MVPDEVLGEVGRQLEVYASAFAEIGRLNREIAALDMQIAARRDELDAHRRDQSTASDTINGLLDDYDSDEDKDAVGKLMDEKLGSAVFGGMFE